MSLIRKRILRARDNVRSAAHSRFDSSSRGRRNESLGRCTCTVQRGRDEPGRNLMRLLRADIMRRRVLDRHGQHDEIAFRSEIALLRN